MNIITTMNFEALSDEEIIRAAHHAALHAQAQAFEDFVSATWDSIAGDDSPRAFEQATETIREQRIKLEVALSALGEMNAFDLLDAIQGAGDGGVPQEFVTLLRLAGQMPARDMLIFVSDDILAALCAQFGLIDEWLEYSRAQDAKSKMPRRVPAALDTAVAKPVARAKLISEILAGA